MGVLGGSYIFFKTFFLQILKNAKKNIFNFSIGCNPLVGSGGEGWGREYAKMLMVDNNKIIPA